MSDFAVERGQDSLGLLGTVVAKHRLLRVLGDGGMGTVYVGEHEILKELRAIKVCKLVGAKGLKERAVNEARMMAKLNHSGICKLYDVELGPPDGTSPVMVMELLHGHSFFDEIAAGAIGWQRAVEVAIDVLDALEEAHRQGIIHRDIKPENVFIARRPDGRLVTKVMDFGIGKLIAVSTTQTGMQMGTPHYMSPEQATNAKAVDARTDIYSVGAMLYRCVTGSYLFPHDSAVRVIAGHLNDQPRPIRSLAPNIPEQLAEIVHRALAKSRGERFGSAVEMRDALRGCVATNGLPISAAAPTVRLDDAARQPTRESRRPSPKLRIAVVVSACVMAAGIAVGVAAVVRARSANVVPASVAPSVEKPAIDPIAAPTTIAAPIVAPTAAPAPRATHKKPIGAVNAAPNAGSKKREQKAPPTNGVITGVFDD